MAVQAFVDSGAQMTIMSRACAERCGVLRLMDRRFQGVAVGVGSAAVLGRVHMAPAAAGGEHFPISITVLDNDQVDFLFGLDNLRRHRCVLDVGAEKLIFKSTGAELPFLPDHLVTRKLGGGAGNLEGLQGVGPQAGSGPAPAPAPHAVHAAPTSATTLQPATSAIPADWEGKVARLGDLGFTRDQAILALRACDGSEDMAASILFGE